MNLKTQDGLMSPEAAETLALDALAWLVAQSDLCGVFMGASGLSENDLRARAGDADVLVAVLDFLVLDDAWVSAYCDDRSLGYDMPMRARATLGGGDVHWT